MKKPSSATAWKEKLSPKPKAKPSKGIRFKHPLATLDPFYDRFSPVLLADYVESTSGTGIVHSAPAYGVDDYISCKSAGFTNDEILNPVQGNGEYAASLPLFGGLNVWKAKTRFSTRSPSQAICCPAAKSCTATCTAGAIRHL